MFFFVSIATKWRVRNHMAFFIDNLQYYLQVNKPSTTFTQPTITPQPTITSNHPPISHPLPLPLIIQVDVIESQCSLLTHRLSQHRDFEQVLLDHDTFLSSLAHQCFLNSKQVRGRMVEMAVVCFFR